MRIVDARTGIEVIPREQCLALLGDDVVGRLAVVSGGAPHVIPVNYAVDGEDVVFRTDHGLKLDDGPRAPACFEIDGFERASRAGWSVVVHGRLEEVTSYDAERYARLQQLGVDPWAAGERQHWMRLVPTSISGRRITA